MLASGEDRIPNGFNRRGDRYFLASIVKQSTSGGEVRMVSISFGRNNNRPVRAEKRGSDRRNASMLSARTTIWRPGLTRRNFQFCSHSSLSQDPPMSRQ